MKNQNEETLDDIEAEIRARAKAWPEPSLAKYDEQLADRIHAAREREVVVSKNATTTYGNNAAMRDAVEAVVRAISEPNDVLSALLLMQADAKCKAALAAPPRNCDMGTAEERMYRYNRLRDEINERYKRLGEIPPSFAFPTAFEWEDRPYEEGGAE